MNTLLQRIRSLEGGKRGVIFLSFRSHLKFALLRCAVEENTLKSVETAQRAARLPVCGDLYHPLIHPIIHLIPFRPDPVTRGVSEWNVMNVLLILA